MTKILVTIVLYNPDTTLLMQTLTCIIPHVDSILLIDNASKNSQEIYNLTKHLPTVFFQRNIENQGLSKAYNISINFSRQNNYDFLLLLDQDTSLDTNFITEYKKHLNQNYTCFAPLIIHKNTEYQKKRGEMPNGDSELVNGAINSGTIININQLPKSIYFDENLFIDWIDADFHYQLSKANLKTLRINTVQILVDIGNKTSHHIFNKVWFSSKYSSFRLNKQAGDLVYFIFKNKDHSQKIEYFKFTIWNWLMIFIFEKNKIKNFFAIVHGLIQGLKITIKQPINKF